MIEVKKVKHKKRTADKHVMHHHGHHHKHHHNQHRGIYKYFKEHGIVVLSAVLGIMFLAVLNFSVSEVTGAVVAISPQVDGSTASMVQNFLPPLGALWFVVAAMAIVTVVMIGIRSQ